MNHFAHHKKLRSLNKKRTIASIDTSSPKTDSSNSQRDYIAAIIGKDVQLDCKMKHLVNEDDKVHTKNSKF